ncbi:MAG: hypothetical protein SAL07_03440 [Oscillatoria sp. PMC 1051.18]|uniref:slr1601 family putative cell division protein n=1 Tax=Oscillatoria salina TaxID=331517 RepID=UPI0013B90E57|nr:hypothetical protein [Oscillatoria salina]MBZ8180055.1 hypothetical protein [Oscillatoria salina IIICB1]MEC4891397.1 hypothetical protein [Oscillatoria sp. PMC 1050.18]MEC5028944.1 hypothetical protein [Oscillatoria sp. PMC 1051.18]NET88895.1 hypothetical protein [Kamptonema sp. SIO1D9]
MNALQTTRPLEEPRRRTTRRPRHRRRYSQGAVVAEITVKILVNGVLSAAAIAALLKLLPYHLSQQAKLREVRTEVKRTEQRVNELRDRFSYSFDPHQTQNIMQEQTGRVQPNQLRVVWLEKKTD